MAEKRFQFRKELVTAHFPIEISNESLKAGEISLGNGVKFATTDNAVIKHAIDDLNKF